MGKKNKYFIGASEFNQWNYCPRKWYLEQTLDIKIKTREARKGKEFHAERGRDVRQIQATQSALITTILVGGVACLLLLLSFLH